MKKRPFLSLLFSIPILLPLSLLAQENDSIYDVPLEDLLNMKVVTASKKEENLGDVPAAMIILTSKQIEERGYESLDDIFQDLPGFDTTRQWGIFNNVWTQRGVSGDENKRTLVFIDGIQENNLFEGNVLGGPHYSLHMAERIEILYGPASALYGANAFGGVVNIITKKGKDLKSVRYARGQGSFGTNFDKFLGGGAKEGQEAKAKDNEQNWDIMVSGSRYSSDGPVFADRDPEWNASYVDNAYSALLRASWKNLTLGFNRFQRPAGEGQFSNLPRYYNKTHGYQNREGTADGTVARTFNGERPSNWEPFTQTVFLTAEQSLSDKLRLSEKYFYKEDGIAEGSFEYYVTANGTFQRDLYSHKSWAHGVEVQADYSPAAHHDLILGAQAVYSDIESNYRSYTRISGSGTAADPIIYRTDGKDARKRFVYRNYSTYLQYKYETGLLQSTTFWLGARYDHNSGWGGAFNPRLGVVNRPHREWIVKLLYGSAFRAPTVKDSYSTTPIRIANPDLRPEKEKSYEVNVTYTPTPSFFVNGGAYYNRASDIIESNVLIAPGSTLHQNRNAGSGYVEGVYLSPTYQILPDLQLRGDFTWQRGRQKDSNGDRRPFPNVSDFKSVAGINYTILNWVVWDINGNWVGKRSLAATNPRGSLDGYFLTHMAFTTKQKLFKFLKLSLFVDNVFDVDYLDPGIRAADGGYYTTAYDQPGRNFIAKATVEYSF